MSWNVDAATRHADDEAEDHATGRCARYVREALEAGGLDLSHHPVSAKDYGPTLELNGFGKVRRYDGATGTVTPAGATDETSYKGDVIVIQPYEGGDPNGHIAIYDGQQWVSDFKQRDMWAGPGYRKDKPSYAVYRFGVRP